jgi:hypothetical protein
MSFIHCECWKTSAGSIGVLYSCSGWCLLLRLCCITTFLVRGVGTRPVILISILQPIAKWAWEVEVVYWDCSWGLSIWRFICTTWFAMFPWSQFAGYTTRHHSRFRDKWPGAMFAPFGGWVCRLLQLLLLRLCVIGFNMRNLTRQCLSFNIIQGVKSGKNGIYWSNKVLQRVAEYCQGSIIKDIFILLWILACLQWPLKQLT